MIALPATIAYAVASALRVCPAALQASGGVAVASPYHRDAPRGRVAPFPEEAVRSTRIADRRAAA
jgi:hypothetical protein